MKHFTKAQWFYLLLLFVAVTGLFLTGIIPAAENDIAEKKQQQYASNANEDAASTSDLTPLADFNALAQVNPNTVGWLYVPDTSINMPVVQSDNNATYLYTDFEGNYSDYGCAFLDAFYQTQHYPAPQNMVVYGHNHRTDASLFGDLEKYLDENFFTTHRTLRYDRPNELALWEIFAVVKVFSDYDYRRPNFTDATDFLNYFTRIQSASLYPTTDSVHLTASDEILTLSTCLFEEDNQRLIIVSRKITN